MIDKDKAIAIKIPDKLYDYLLTIDLCKNDKVNFGKDKYTVIGIEENIWETIITLYNKNLNNYIKLIWYLVFTHGSLYQLEIDDCILHEYYYITNEPTTDNTNKNIYSSYLRDFEE